MSNFVSPVYTFSLAGNIVASTPVQSTIREKKLFSYYLRSKNADSGGKKNTLRPFLFSWTATFPSFDENYGCNPSERDIKVIIPAPIQKIITSIKDQTGFP